MLSIIAEALTEITRHLYPREARALYKASLLSQMQKQSRLIHRVNKVIANARTRLYEIIKSQERERERQGRVLF